MRRPKVASVPRWFVTSCCTSKCAGVYRANVAGSVERSERQERADCAARHDKARDMHNVAAVRHDAAALRWAELGDSTRADFERRNARIEREAAELEGDRARFYRGRSA